MTNIELLFVINECRAKFHALAVAIKLEQRGEMMLNLHGILKIVEEGNQKCGDTLNRCPEWSKTYLAEDPS